MIFPANLYERAKLCVNKYRKIGKMIAFAESCTGGLISGLITAVPGSSAVLERGFVVYSNQAKKELLGVKEETLHSFGAVSAETAQEMAQGAILYSKAQVSVSVTGIAGPGGGSEEKPVGLVYIGWQEEGQAPRSTKLLLKGNREEVRLQTIEAVIDLLLT